MDNILFTSYRIEERSYVSFVKREIHRLIAPVFDAMRTGEIDIVVAELTSNLVKYAGRGELLYRLSVDDEGPLFELLCIDSGPGMKNVRHSMRDGFSSTTSLGQGMGSIVRLSNFAQTYSLLDWGTIVYCRFRKSLEYEEKKHPLLIRAINVAKPGELVSGDGYTVRIAGEKTALFVGDGLGHGPGAREVAERAIEAFQASEQTDPSMLIRELNEKVRKTRGLVATIAVFDKAAKKWELCGVGNINTKVYTGLEYKGYVCNNGIVGMNIPTRIDNLVITAQRYQQAILCSDGIRTRWDLFQYPSVLKYDPMILAAAIYKDHARQTDDMTVLIARVV